MIFCCLGELIKIVIEDYVNHLANYNLKIIYKPDLLFGEGYDYDNRIHLEFNHMYHWHPFNPDEYNISGTIYSIDDFMYHPELTVKHGMRDFVDSMSRNLAGKVHTIVHCWIFLWMHNVVQFVTFGAVL